MEVPVPQYKITPKIFLDPLLTALIVVDMQIDFVAPGGKLLVREARRTVPAIRRLIVRAREARVPVIFTQDWHRPDDPEFSIWPPHTVEGTNGAQIIPELNPLPEDYFIRKRTYDPFFSTDLDLLLRQKGIQKLLIVGTVSNICVLHTAASGRLRGYEIVVASDGLSSLTPFDQEAALRQISSVYQGTITRSPGVKFSKG